jgi:cell division protease FtsH
MAKALIKYETIDKSQIDDLILGKEPQAPDGWEEALDGSTGNKVIREESTPLRGSKTDFA